jgi:hypothetical protein
MAQSLIPLYFDLGMFYLSMNNGSYFLGLLVVLTVVGQGTD